MTLTSRKVARKALGALLKTALEGTGKLAQAVYDHAPADFATSPVVFVRSAPTNRQPMGIGGSSKTQNIFHLEVMIYVAAGNLEASWSPEDSQDKADDIEAVVSQVVAENRVNAAWQSLRRVDTPSEMLQFPAHATGGFPYDIEIVTVEVTTYDT